MTGSVEDERILPCKTVSGETKNLLSLYWYDGPLIFLMDHEGVNRIFTMYDQDEEGIHYFGATPSQETMDLVQTNTIPLIEAYKTGPFFSMRYDAKLMALTDPVEIPEFPKDCLPNSKVFLVYKPDHSDDPEV